MTTRRAAIQQRGGESIPGPRDFVYITPRGRRISEYEALTLYVQPLEADSPTPRAMRSTWPEDNTLLRCGDWFNFRDPAQMWSRSYVARQAEQERSLERASETARAAGFYARIDDDWAALLGDVYVTAGYFEKGLSWALDYAQMNAPADVIGVAGAFQSIDKQRHAEDILFHHYDLRAAGLPVGDDGRRSAWLEDSQFQPMRELVERIIATRDWAEIIITVNLVVEPLLGRYLFNEVLLRQGAVHGDMTTGPILLEAESDRERNLDWTVDLVELLLTDEVHGGDNRGVLSTWLEQWTPRVDVVLESLRPVALRAGADHDAAVAAVRDGQATLLERSGLIASAEVAP
ncbi:MAG: hypothetical protein Q8K58_01685 [Acidimicrobiales bacterium]|nr:hypothetical protein [Acidimicrobiales bacterium]